MLISNESNASHTLSLSQKYSIVGLFNVVSVCNNKQHSAALQRCGLRNEVVSNYEKLLAKVRREFIA